MNSKTISIVLGMLLIAEESLNELQKQKGRK